MINRLKTFILIFIPALVAFIYLVLPYLVGVQVQNGFEDFVKNIKQEQKTHEQTTYVYTRNWFNSTVEVKNEAMDLSAVINISHKLLHLSNNFLHVLADAKVTLNSETKRMDLKVDILNNTVSLQGELFTQANQSVILGTNKFTAKMHLNNMVGINEIDFHAEEMILQEVMYSQEEPVDIFVSDLSISLDNSNENNKSYDLINFSFGDLQVKTAKGEEFGLMKDGVIEFSIYNEFTKDGKLEVSTSINFDDFFANDTKFNLGPFGMSFKAQIDEKDFTQLSSVMEKIQKTLVITKDDILKIVRILTSNEPFNLRVTGETFVEQNEHTLADVMLDSYVKTDFKELLQSGFKLQGYITNTIYQGAKSILLSLPGYASKDKHDALAKLIEEEEYQESEVQNIYASIVKSEDDVYKLDIDTDLQNLLAAVAIFILQKTGDESAEQASAQEAA